MTRIQVIIKHSAHSRYFLLYQIVWLCRDDVWYIILVGWLHQCINPNKSSDRTSWSWSFFLLLRNFMIQIILIFFVKVKVCWELLPYEKVSIFVFSITYDNIVIYIFLYIFSLKHEVVKHWISFDNCTLDWHCC